MGDEGARPIGFSRTANHKIDKGESKIVVYRGLLDDARGLNLKEKKYTGVKTAVSQCFAV